LIRGSRGIGKSSLAAQLRRTLQGETRLLQKHGIDIGNGRFDALVVEHECDTESDTAALLQTLLVKLEQEVDGDLLGQFDTELTLGGGGLVPGEVKITEASKSDLGIPVKAQLEGILADICATENRNWDSVAIFIDNVEELAKPGPTIEILMGISAALRKKGLSNLYWVMCGNTAVHEEMVDYNLSISRFIHPVDVPLMKDAPLRKIIDRALRDSRVTIASSARRRIIELAGGFPEPVHLLGYHSFRYCQDHRIRKHHVEDAVEHVVKHVKKANYRSLHSHLERTSEQQDILKAMALHDDNNEVTLETIIDKTGMERSEAGGELGSLNSEEVVRKVDRGVFELREPLFKIYLQWWFEEE
jgi:hypothetical protein